MGIDAKLKAEWARKLRESGFVDIERAGGRLVDEAQFNNRHLAKGQTLQTFDMHRRYYEVAQHIVEQDARSKTTACLPMRTPAATQALIRGLHAEGMTNREIAKEVGIHRDTVSKIVRAFAQQIREEIRNEKAEASLAGATQR